LASRGEDLILLMFAQHPRSLAIPDLQRELALTEAHVLHDHPDLGGFVEYSFIASSSSEFSSEAEIALSRLMRDGLIAPNNSSALRLALTPEGKLREMEIKKEEAGERLAGALGEMDRVETTRLLRDYVVRLNSANLPAETDRKKTPARVWAGC